MLNLIRRLLGLRPPVVASLVRKRFSQIASSPGTITRRIGRAVAVELGYDPSELAALPINVTDSFAGVGNPLSLGELQVGQVVVDLGSGAGLDSILAARKVGPQGRVIGIDMTHTMIQKARKNIDLLGLANVEFREVPIEALDLPGNVADVAICNGLFNLCEDKPGALAQVYSVLKPGGRFLIADILLEDRVTAKELARRGTWSD
ncbi:hypothetical protein BH10PLA2_BH10PLA2_03240 [soil metagenome]